MTDLARFAADHGLRHFLFSFSDLFGVQRAKLVPASAVADLAEAGAGFAGFAAWLDMTPADPEAVAELVDNTAYVFRVKALAWGTKSESEWSWTMPMSTRHEENCTRSYGYWKTHQGAWPVSSAKMGTVTYNGPQILAVFTKAPAGNGFLILAHQLLAARLNIAQGAVPTSDVVSAIAAADALIGGLVCPPVGTGVLAPASVTSLIGTLTNFNEGDNGVKQCTTVATRTSTWGGLKLLYR